MPEHDRFESQNSGKFIIRWNPSHISRCVTAIMHREEPAWSSLADPIHAELHWEKMRRLMLTVSERSAD